MTKIKNLVTVNDKVTLDTKLEFVDPKTLEGISDYHANLYTLAIRVDDRVYPLKNKDDELLALQIHTTPHAFVIDWEHVFNPLKGIWERSMMASHFKTFEEDAEEKRKPFKQCGYE